MPEWLIGAFVEGLIGGVITILLFSLVISGREQEERQRLVWENEHLKQMLDCSYTKVYGRDIDKLRVAADLYDSRGIVLEDIIEAYMLGYKDYEMFVDKAFQEAVAIPTDDGMQLSISVAPPPNHLDLEELEIRLKSREVFEQAGVKPSFRRIHTAEEVTDLLKLR